MSFKIVVLAKQVPDTRNVGKDAMKADGTVNRAALPALRQDAPVRIGWTGSPGTYRYIAPLMPASKCTAR